MKIIKKLCVYKSKNKRPDRRICTIWIYLKKATVSIPSIYTRTVAGSSG